MSESVPDPRLQSLINKLRPGPVRSVTVAGFDGGDVLVLLEESGEEGSEVGRIPQNEVSIRRTDHPSEVLRVGQQIEAEEIGRWRGQLSLSARACENPELRAFLVAIRPGQIVSGTVSGVHNFGVFVHLGVPVRTLSVRHEALLFRTEVEDHRRLAVVAARRSWRQPKPGIAGEGESSLDKVGSAQHCRMGRAR